MDTQYYDDIIIGGGKAGKTLALALVADGRKTALVERSLNMIGGSCRNIACIPLTKLYWKATLPHPILARFSKLSVCCYLVLCVQRYFRRC